MYPIIVDPEVTAREKTYSWETVIPYPRRPCPNYQEDINPESRKHGYHADEKAPLYTRKVPAKYAGTGGDDFMLKYIKEFAVEGGKLDGKPNGQFWFEKEGAKRACKQVVLDYMHVTPEEADDIVCNGF